MGEKKNLQKGNLGLVTQQVVVDRYLEKETRLTIPAGESWRIILIPSDGKTSKKLTVRLAGDNSQAEILGVIVGASEDNFHLTVDVIHQGFGTSAFTNVRGVLFDKSQALFSGLIKIEKKANKTASLLENRFLILGENARADSLPNLEIEADDVKASHAATVGHVDESQLFYLQSRGIGKHTAVRMIVDGFLEPILSKIEDEGLIAEVRGRLWLDVLKH